MTESVSQRMVAQELDERGSQGVGGGRGGFGHEGGGVVGEQAGVETLVVVSRGRERNQEGRQSRAREFGQRGGSRSRDDAGGAAVLLGHVAKERLHVGRQRQRGITLTNRVEIGCSGLMHRPPTGKLTVQKLRSRRVAATGLAENVELQSLAIFNTMSGDPTISTSHEEECDRSRRTNRMFDTIAS